MGVIVAVGVRVAVAPVGVGESVGVGVAVTVGVAVGVGVAVAPVNSNSYCCPLIDVAAPVSTGRRVTQSPALTENDTPSHEHDLSPAARVHIVTSVPPLYAALQLWVEEGVPFRNLMSRVRLEPRAVAIWNQPFDVVEAVAAIQAVPSAVLVPEVQEAVANGPSQRKGEDEEPEIRPV